MTKCGSYRYDSTAEMRGQRWDWDCSAAATAWMGRSLGWGWAEGDVAYEFVRAGIATPQLGLLDGTGAGIVRWLSEQPFSATNTQLSFDDLVLNLATCPAIMGSTKWYHWVGVRGTVGSGTLALANSAPGWAGIWQTLAREEYDMFGDFWIVLPA